MKKPLWILGVVMAVVAAIIPAVITWADGTETLGPPSITTHSGTGIAVGGTGLYGGDGVLATGTIDVNVPSGATISQVLLYWEGARNASATPPPSTTLLVNGQPATGSVIGGPTLLPLIPPPDAELISYRADITGLGVVSPGANSLTISGSPFVDRTNAGAGVVVIFDDGSGASTIDIRDGNDFAIAGGTPTLDAVVPQTFAFPASTVARTAELSLFIADVQPHRSYTIHITVDGVVSTFPNIINQVQVYKVGNFWDVANLPVNIPAGETSLTATIISEGFDGNRAASFVWVAAGLNVPNPAPGINIEKLTNGNDADDANDADVPQIAPGDPVTWTYQVTNTGDIAFDVSEVAVTDDIIGAVTNIVDMGDGDNTLSPGEVWLYEASVPGAEDLQNPSAGVVVVQGCNPGNLPGGDRETYENIGTVTAGGETDSDPSHYCNPPNPAIDIEKATNGKDADSPTGPIITVGETATFTYVVTNTGNVALANIVVVDDGGTDGDMSDDFNPDPVLSGGFNVGDADMDNMLDLDEAWQYTASRTVTPGQYTNNSQACGNSPNNQNVCDEDPSNHFGDEPPQGGQGCTPGYWKQEHHFDSWVTYDPSDSYSDVFGVSPSFGDKTLLQVLKQGGGGEKALGRHAVAALLNTATNGVSYAFTTSGVVDLVQQAYATNDFNGIKNQLEAENEMGCPLN